MGLDLKLGAFIVGLLTVTAIVFFGVIAVNMGTNWVPHIKAFYLIGYGLLILIIINFLMLSEKKKANKRGKNDKSI